MTFPSSVKWVVAAAMIVAPILLAASTIAYGLGGGINRDVLGGTIQVYAMAAFAFVILGLVALLSPHRPTVAALLLVSGIVGVAGGIGFGVDSVHAGLPGGAKLAELAPAAAFPSLILLGIIMPPSLIGLGVGLFASGVGPRWATAAVIVGAALFPLSRVPGILPLALLADVVLLAGVVPLALVLGRRSEAPVADHRAWRADSVAAEG